MTARSERRRDTLLGVAELPDFAVVRIDVVAAILACSTRTVERRVEAGLIPEPQKQGGLRTWRIGTLRNALR